MVSERAVKMEARALASRPGGTEPNIKCHGCGHWILVDIEDCQGSGMTAARTREIELRPVSSKNEPVV